MCICSSQVVNPGNVGTQGCSQEAGKSLLQRDLLDFNADLVPLGILDGGKTAPRHPLKP